jgi:D-tyrosyl-tRNA(Tyr) deacylase
MGAMRTVIQRVSRASVTINNKIRSEIGAGLLIFIGIEESDNENDVEWLCNKVVNFSVLNAEGNILVISQVTLHAKTRKGNRLSYIRAANPDIAIPLYNMFIRKLSELLGKEVGSGEFGAMMQIELVNDGPVTIIIDTKEKE